MREQTTVTAMIGTKIRLVQMRCGGWHASIVLPGCTASTAPTAVEAINAVIESASAPCTCRWSQDSEGGWYTQCEERFDITHGTPTENSMRYCCYCGRKIDEELLPVEGEA